MTYPPILPPPRRVVSGFSSTGASSIVFDDLVPMRLFSHNGVSGNFGQVWKADGLPQDLGDTKTDMALDTVDGVVNKGGSVMKCVDFGPGAGDSMHYTHSIDYAIVLSGAITMGTSDGARTTVGAGGLIVQLGQLHDWKNETEEWCRIIFVGIESKPLEFEGKPIEGTRKD